MEDDAARSCRGREWVSVRLMQVTFVWRFEYKQVGPLEAIMVNPPIAMRMGDSFLHNFEHCMRLGGESELRQVPAHVAPCVAVPQVHRSP